MRALRFIKAKWQNIAIVLLLLNLLIGTALPALADVIRIQAQPALNDISDVNAGAPSDDDVLSWDDGTSKWISEASPGGLWEVDGADTQLITLDDIDFEKYKAIALVCDNGATVPAAPTAGQWYLHTPTGRNILMQYDGSNWIPIMSIGTMTVYVDNTDGTDGINYGGAVDADAFATVQYSIDVIPGLVGGSVDVYVNDETYNEIVAITGKNAAGTYMVNVHGTLTELASATADSKTTGSSGVQGTLTDTGAFGAYDNKLLYITATGEYRIIDSDTADVITIVACFADNTNLAYKIYDWGTSIDRMAVVSDGIGVAILSLKLAGSSNQALWARYGASVSVQQCYITGISLVQDYGTCSFLYSLAIASFNLGGTIYCQSFGNAIYIQRCKVQNTHTGGYCVFVKSASTMIQYGTILDGADDAHGLVVMNNGAATVSNSYSAGFCHIRNCEYGIYAYQGGQVTSTALVVYSGNDANENPQLPATSASYGYID